MNNLLIAQPEVLMDPIMDQSFEFLQNPYALFEKYRAQGPVTYSSRGNHWIVTGYTEANQMLRDNNFGKKMELWKHPSPLMRGIFSYLRSRNTGNLLLQDAPDHTRVRTLVQSAFLPSTVRALEQHISEICQHLTADVKPGDGLSFGAGIHYCLGAELARSEARIAVSTLLRKFPDIKLASTDMTYKAPFALRGLQALQVIY